MIRIQKGQPSVKFTITVLTESLLVSRLHPRATGDNSLANIGTTYIASFFGAANTDNVANVSTLQDFKELMEEMRMEFRAQLAGSLA